MRIAAAALLVLVSIGSACLAQEESKPLPFEDKLVEALFNKQVQAELDLVDDQRSAMKQILVSLQKKRDELGRELAEFKDSGASEADVKAKHLEFLDDFKVDKHASMESAMEVLLPHQQKRLRQTAVQIMMRNSAKEKRVPSGVLTPEVREYLEINDEQAARIKAKAIELQKQVAEKIKKITEQAQAELMEELSEQQRAKYEDLIGDPITR